VIGGSVFVGRTLGDVSTGVSTAGDGAAELCALAGSQAAPALATATATATLRTSDAINPTTAQRNLAQQSAPNPGAYDRYSRLP